VVESTIPIVQIITPEAGDFFVQGQEIDITVDARHNNGINKVQLYVNNIFLSELSGQSSNTYAFNFIPSSSYLGTTELKAVAIANFTGTTGTDSITINIEGILPKRISSFGK
jgi:hypothetical protein